MFKLWAILRLTRLDSSLLGFLVILIPFLVRTTDLSSSVGKAIPLLFIGMCAFIANDLDDQEADRVNHPDRPLPARHLSTTVAAVLLFVSLAAALFSTRQWVEPHTAFWYYALVTLSISYGYIVEYVPGAKAPYVAVVTSIPVMIVASSFPNEPRLRLVAGATVLLVFGREVCMDIADRAGDATSFIHKIKATSLAVIAFLLHTMGLLLLAIQVRTAGQVIDLLILAFLIGLSGVCWFKLGDRKKAIMLMKLQFIVGLYFLT